VTNERCLFETRQPKHGSAIYTAPLRNSSVLLTIDVQEDFSRPGAPAEIPGTCERIPAMLTVLRAYREQKLPIVHVVRLYSADGKNVDLCRREQVESGLRIVLPGSPGAELARELQLHSGAKLDAERLLLGQLQVLGPNEWAMYKPRWDAFFETCLDSHLRKFNIDTVVILGCNFPNCPRSTAYGASMRDFRVMMVQDAISGIYERGIEELERIGIRAVTAETCTRWLAHQG
jgi:nicotinamidase-related amidase